MRENEEEINDAVELYNKYVNVLNVLNINVKTNLSTAITKLNTAYDVFNRSIECSDKSAKLDSLNEIIDFLANNKNLIQNTIIPQIEQKMNNLKNEYGLII